MRSMLIHRSNLSQTLINKMTGTGPMFQVTTLMRQVTGPCTMTYPPQMCSLTQHQQQHFASASGTGFAYDIDDDDGREEVISIHGSFMNQEGESAESKQKQTSWSQKQRGNSTTNTHFHILRGDAVRLPSRIYYHLHERLHGRH